MVHSFEKLIASNADAVSARGVNPAPHRSVLTTHRQTSLSGPVLRKIAESRPQKDKDTRLWLDAVLRIGAMRPINVEVSVVVGACVEREGSPMRCVSHW